MDNINQRKLIKGQITLKKFLLERMKYDRFLEGIKKGYVQKMGRELTSFCKENNISLGKRKDKYYGEVNTYPREVLEEYIKCKATNRKPYPSENKT